MRRGWLALSLLGSIGTARADDGSYRGEIAAVDLGANGLAALGIAADGPVGDVMFVAGLIGSELGGPIDHGIHGNWGRLGISLGTHVATTIPAVLVVRGFASSTTSEDPDSSVIKLAGFALLCNLVATGVDIAMAGSSSSSTTPRIVSLGMQF